MPKRRKKKKGGGQPEEASEQDKNIPRCFVVKRGRVGERVRDLIKDFRQVMMPNCAIRLRETRMNRVEDYVAVAGHFHVTHLIIFSASNVATWMKIAKLPQGPTLTFKVDSFTLARDVKASQKRPRSSPRDYQFAPLQVLNGFSAGGQNNVQQLSAEMLRGLFPAIDVPNFKQGDASRTVLFHQDREKDAIFFRHYSVARRPVGVQRGVKKLLRIFRPPKLGQCKDIADFVLSGGVGASESELSEAEEVPASTGYRMGVRLVETGPRLSLQLVKAEEGLCTGAVLYHRYKKHLPTPQEVAQAKAREKRKLQERNDKLTAMANKKKAKLQEEKKRRKQAREEEEDGGNDALLEGVKGGGAKGGPKGGSKGGAKGGNKKERFHPFAFGAKRTSRQADKADGEIDSGKGQGGNRSGEPSQKKQRVLDRFRSATGR